MLLLNPDSFADFQHLSSNISTLRPPDNQQIQYPELPRHSSPSLCLTRGYLRQSVLKNKNSLDTKLNTRYNLHQTIGGDHHQDRSQTRNQNAHPCPLGADNVGIPQFCILLFDSFSPKPPILPSLPLLALYTCRDASTNRPVSRKTNPIPKTPKPTQPVMLQRFTPILCSAPPPKTNPIPPEIRFTRYASRLPHGGDTLHTIRHKTFARHLRRH